MNTGSKFWKLVGVIFLLAFLPLGLYGVRKAVEYLTHAGGVEANLVIDAQATFSRDGDVWKNLAQGGEERGQMLTSVITPVRKIGPKYIRIDHIYDSFNVVSKDSNGQINFNWQELDKTVDDILAIGAKPFISLSYMPPAISSGSIVDQPTNWADWELIVQRTIEHFSGTRGIQNVYYEVWNEPDLFGGFKVYGNKNYLNLYTHSAIGAARASGVQNFKFGGPAITALYKSWFDSLLKHAQNNRLRLDFFSWHRYSKNLDDFESDVTNVHNWIVNYPSLSGTEFIISEMGPNSDNDPVYDNSFSGIHAVATAAVLQGQIGKGFNFEIKDGPGEKQFWGRWGIFTHDKFGAPQAKPRYYAFTFLNRMTGQDVTVGGTGSWVKAFAKKDANGTLRTLVVNYDPSGKHSEAVPMTFANLASTNFTLRRINYSGKVEEEQVATTSGTWETLQEFSPNTAAIFEIVPR